MAFDHDGERCEEELVVSRYYHVQRLARVYLIAKASVAVAAKIRCPKERVMWPV